MATRIGTDGGDLISGTGARDRLIGRGGDDRINGLGGRDVVQGGSGSDSVFGGRGGDQIAGGAGDDVVEDIDGPNRIRGGTGDDFISASGIVDAGSGDDLLLSRSLDGRLTGGAGADTFQLATLFGDGASPTTVDLVADFDRAEGDRLDVLIATTGNDASSVAFVGTGPFTGVAQARYEVARGDTFVLVNNDADLAPDGAIRLDGAFELTADDFSLVA